MYFKNLNLYFVLMKCAVFWVCSVACTNQKNLSNSLQVAITSQPQTLDPRFATDANGQYISHLIFNSLVKIGPNLEAVGDAAQSWSYNNLTYTFDLHKNLTFSNGRPITKEDILFTFKQYTTQGPFKSSLSFIKEFKVETVQGRLQVQLVLSQYRPPLSFFADLSVVKILPQAIVTQHKDHFHRHIIGSGPFILEKQSTHEIILKAREQHPIVTPQIKEVVFKIIKNDNTLYFKTLKEELDIVPSGIPFHRVKQFENNKKFQVFKYPSLKMSYILLNLKDPLLSDLSVRKAIASGFNRKEIIQFKLSGLASLATSLLTPSHPFFHKRLHLLEYNLKTSQKVLSQVELPKPLLLKTSNNPTSVEVGKVIVNQLRKAGLNVQMQSFEWATYYGDIQAGRFQMAIMTWVGVMAPDLYKMALHSLEIPPKGRNRGFYKNTELDRLVEQAAQTESLEKRKSIYHKVQELVMKDLPIIPLWYPTDVAIVHKRILNYKPSLNGDFTPLMYVKKQ